MNTLNNLCALATTCTRLLHNSTQYSLSDDLQLVPRNVQASRLAASIKVATKVIAIASSDGTGLHSCFLDPSFSSNACRFAYMIRSLLIKDMDITALYGVDHPNKGILDKARRLLTECGLISRNSKISLNLQQIPTTPEQLEQLKSIAEDQLCLQHTRHKIMGAVQPFYWLLFLDKAIPSIDTEQLFDFKKYYIELAGAQKGTYIPLKLKNNKSPYRPIVKKLIKATQDWMNSIEIRKERVLQQSYLRILQETPVQHDGISQADVSQADISSIQQIAKTFYLQALSWHLHQQISQQNVDALDECSGQLSTIFTAGNCHHTNSQALQLYSMVSYIHALFYTSLYPHTRDVEEMNGIMGWVTTFAGLYTAETAAIKTPVTHQYLSMQANQAKQLATAHFDYNLLKSSIASFVKQKVVQIYALAYAGVNMEIRQAFAPPDQFLKKMKMAVKAFDFSLPNLSLFDNIEPTQTTQFPPIPCNLLEKIEQLKITPEEFDEPEEFFIHQSITPAVTAPTMNELSYSCSLLPIQYKQRVLRFAQQGVKLFEVDEQYKNTPPQEQAEIFYRHAFPKEVDALVFTQFVKLNWRNRLGKCTIYACPGTLNFNGTIHKVIVEYCMDIHGICYHRFIANESKARSHLMTKQDFYSRDPEETPEEALGLWQIQAGKILIEESAESISFISTNHEKQKIVLTLQK